MESLMLRKEKSFLCRKLMLVGDDGLVWFGL